LGSSEPLTNSQKITEVLLKPCGFSRPGDFFDTIRTEGTGGARQAWQAKKYGIPDLAQIAEGCRIFSRSQAEGGRLPPSPPAVTL
ncbi:hypothetical protein, partial [uncultured Alistipes sp.]|uniref:hypothetical protein n=1 Tax=uncultured Alistipes sp. TaxID=538949 RepID=UPI002732D861